MNPCSRTLCNNRVMANNTACLCVNLLSFWMDETTATKTFKNTVKDQFNGNSCISYSSKKRFNVCFCFTLNRMKSTQWKTAVNSMNPSMANHAGYRRHLSVPDSWLLLQRTMTMTAFPLKLKKNFGWICMTNRPTVAVIGMHFHSRFLYRESLDVMASKLSCDDIISDNGIVDRSGWQVLCLRASDNNNLKLWILNDAKMAHSLSYKFHWNERDHSFVWRSLSLQCQHTLDTKMSNWHDLRIANSHFYFPSCYCILLGCGFVNYMLVRNCASLSLDVVGRTLTRGPSCNKIQSLSLRWNIDRTIIAGAHCAYSVFLLLTQHCQWIHWAHARSASQDLLSTDLA